MRSKIYDISNKKEDKKYIHKSNVLIKVAIAKLASTWEGGGVKGKITYKQTIDLIR